MLCDLSRTFQLVRSRLTGMAGDGWKWLGRLFQRRRRGHHEIPKKIRRPRDEYRHLVLGGEREAYQMRAMGLGLGFVDLDRAKIDPSTVATLDGNCARLYRLAPLRRDGNRLWIAMADPTDIRAIEAAKAATGCQVVPIVAVPGDLDAWLSRHYPSEPECIAEASSSP